MILHVEDDTNAIEVGFYIDDKIIFYERNDPNILDIFGSISGLFSFQLFIFGLII